MNRRSFVRSLALAGAAFSILPSALTYSRQWKFQRKLFVPQDYVFVPQDCVMRFTPDRWSWKPGVLTIYGFDSRNDKRCFTRVPLGMDPSLDFNPNILVWEYLTDSAGVLG